MVPNTTVAAAMDAPVEPMLTNAAALPALTAPAAATNTDALGFDRNAVTGRFVPPPTTPEETHYLDRQFRRPSRSISGLMASGSPTSATATPPCFTAITAPGDCLLWTVVAGPLRPAQRG